MKLAEMIEYFGLSGNEDTDVSVKCPLHNDTNNSASINIRKGVFNCFAGCGGMTLQDLANQMSGEIHIPEVVETPPPLLDPATLQAKAVEFIKSRRIGSNILKQFKTSIADEYGSFFYGHLVFNLGKGRFVGRRIIDEAEPKYKLEGKRKMVGFDPDKTDFILTEGIFDHMTLLQLELEGVTPMCALGSTITDSEAYKFRKKTVFLLLDNDYAGFIGAEGIAKQVARFGGTAITLELPHDFGKDVNEAWCNAPEEFTAWLNGELSKYDTTDTSYVKELLSGEYQGTPIFSTGFPTLDDEEVLGGLPSGIHMIYGAPEAGKSQLVCNLSVKVAEQGGRVLIASYELPKLQYWARIASRFTDVPWAILERHPQQFPPDVEQLADKIRVVTHWSLAQIVRASRNYDMVVVDYIQPLAGSGDNERGNIEKAIEELASLVATDNKIILCISSMTKAQLKDRDISVGKGSVNIGYSAQSGIVVEKLVGTDKIMLTMNKNTRGKSKTFFLKGDLGHCKFEECNIEEVTHGPASKEVITLL